MSRKRPATAAGPAIHVKDTFEEALVAGYKNPAAFARAFLDADPYPAQETFLRKSKDTSESNFVAGNRTGKSWTAGVVLLWKAFYRHIAPHRMPEHPSPHVSYKAVSTSLTLDQAKLAWNYALTFSESKRFKPFVREVKQSPFPEIHITTRDAKGDTVNSEIWARSLAKGGLYLLGHSISFVLIDECAYIRGYPVIEDEVLRMRLADQGGSLMRISTPNGRNFFFDKFQEGEKGDPRVYSQRIATYENPTVPKAVLEEMRERMLPEFYRQNVEAEFVSLSDFFKLEDIQKLYEDWDYSLPVEPVKGATYVMGIDLGAIRDPTVVIVWRVDKQPYETVFVGSMQNQQWRASREFAARVYGTYLPAATYIDATGAGKPVAQQLVEEDGLAGAEQFIFSHTSKPEIMVRLQDAVQRRRFVFPYVSATREMVQQLSFYRLDDKAISQDYPIALALVNAAAEQLNRSRGTTTEIYDDLACMTVHSGGNSIAGADDFGPGALFRLDPQSGLFIPNTVEVGADEWDFLNGF